MTDKWIAALSAYADGREATCPKCGGHHFKDAYIEVDKKNHTGWGAFWCEDCRNAFALSRVILTSSAIRKKIVAQLPVDLKLQ